MGKVDKTRLLYGPYYTPRTRPGRKLFCEIRGTLTVGGFQDGRIMWPYARLAGRPLILCGDLVKAVRRESATAIRHHFGVSFSMVGRWRRELKVPLKNEGTYQLKRSIAIARDDDRLERARVKSKKPRALKKASKSLKGRIQSPATIAAVKEAAKRPRSEVWKQKMSKFWRKKKKHPPGHPERTFWTKREHAMLGKFTDSEVAKRISRTWVAVRSRRKKFGIASFRKQRRRFRSSTPHT